MTLWCIELRVLQLHSILEIPKGKDRDDKYQNVKARFT